MCRSALPVPHLHGAVRQGSDEGSPRLLDHVAQTGTRAIIPIIGGDGSNADPGSRLSSPV